MIKIKINSLDEAAKWRSTSFKSEWTPEEIEKIGSENDPDTLFFHYDSGINMDGDEYTDSLTGEKGRRDYRTIKDKEGNPVRQVFPRLEPQTTFNPKTEYSTPIGIYAYPWTYAVDQIFDITIPFAQEGIFLYIYKAKNKDKVIQIHNSESGHFFEKSIYHFLKKYSSDEHVKHLIRNDLISSKIFKPNATKMINLFYSENADANQNLDDHNTFSNSTNLSMPDHESFMEIINTYHINYGRAWFYFVNNACNRSPAAVTKHFQDLGIEVLVDEGEGIIHPAEPSQAIIFNPAFAKLVGVKENPSSKRADKSERTTVKSIADHFTASHWKKVFDDNFINVKPAKEILDLFKKLYPTYSIEVIKKVVSTVYPKLKKEMLNESKKIKIILR